MKNKILMVGNFGKSWDGSICDEEHIASAFESFDWEVGRFQREDTNGEWPEFEPTVILVAQWNGYPIDFVNTLRDEYKAKVIYWAFDYQWDSQEEWHFTMARQADLFLSKELDHKTDYEEMGAKFHWFSQDFSPEFLEPYAEPVDKIYDLIFTGTYLPQATYRNEFLKTIDERFRLDIFTVTEQAFRDAGFKNVHSAVVDEGLPRLYAESKIGISVDWKQADGYWSDRMAQMLCCGLPVVNQYVPLQENFYPHSLHVGSVEGAVRMINLLLADPKLRQSLSNFSSSHARALLTTKTKIQSLLHVMSAKELF